MEMALESHYENIWFHLRVIPVKKEELMTIKRDIDFEDLKFDLSRFPNPDFDKNKVCFMLQVIILIKES